MPLSVRFIKENACSESPGHDILPRRLLLSIIRASEREPLLC